MGQGVGPFRCTCNISFLKRRKKIGSKFSNMLTLVKSGYRSHVCVCVSCSVASDSAIPWPVHGILQARILEWVAIPFSRESFQPRDQTSVSYVSCIGRQVFYHQCQLGSPFKHSKDEMVTIRVTSVWEPGAHVILEHLFKKRNKTFKVRKSSIGH